MNAQDQAISSSVSIDTDQDRTIVLTPRLKFILAQASMVVGYLVVTLKPLDGDAALLGLFFEAIALLLYVMSKHTEQGV